MGNAGLWYQGWLISTHKTNYAPFIMLLQRNGEEEFLLQTVYPFVANILKSAV